MPGRTAGDRPQRRLGDAAVGRARRALVAAAVPRPASPGAAAGRAAGAPRSWAGSVAIGTVPVVVGGADTPLAMLAVGARRAAGQPRHRRPGAAPGGAAAAARPTRSSTSTPTSATAGTRWRRCRTAARRGTWVAGMLGLTGVRSSSWPASAPAGAGGVGFSPWLTGERGGVAGPDDRGGCTGLSAGTTRADLARAAVEGVVRGRRATRLLGGAATARSCSPAAAPGRRGPQLLADVLGRPVTASGAQRVRHRRRDARRPGGRPGAQADCVSLASAASCSEPLVASALPPDGPRRRSRR